MAEFLENWILQNLGIVIKINASSIGQHFKNGILFKKLLQSYGVLSDCHTIGLEQSSCFRVCRTNLLHLWPYFKLLNIECDEDAINNIAAGKGSTIIRILYELYICFENRKHIYFITSQAERDVLKNRIPSKFNVMPSESPEDLQRNDVSYRNLVYPLLQHKHITDWYKGKYRLIKSRMEKAKRAVKTQSVSGKDFTQIKYSKPKRTSECKTFNLPELNRTKIISSFDNQDSFTSYDEYIRSIKIKKNTRKIYKSLANKMENMLFEDMWSKILCMQEVEFYKHFTKTLLKQSQYEKCIATKLFQVQQSSTLQNENRKEVTCLLGKVTEARSQMKLDFHKARGVYDDDKLRTLELHRKLYADKLKRRYERHYGICLETLDDIIDLAVKTYKFKEKYNCSLPISLWNDWKEMFFHLEFPHENEIDVPLKGDTESYEDILLVKFRTENVLNDHDTDEYLRFCGEWSAEEISTVIGETMEKQIILGFIVHRLLESKYPLPAPPQPADLPQMTTAAIILNLYDKDTQDKLRQLLSKPAVHIFDLQTVINHCLEMYYTEVKGPEALEEEKPSEKKKLTKTKLSEKKQPKKYKKKKSSNGDNTNLNKNEIINTNDKETQTLGKMEETPVDSTVQETPLGLVGKCLLQILNSGKEIPDSLAVTAIIEYIKSLEVISGWVLLNFPVTIVQASALELALTGTSFLIDNEETDESIKLQQNLDGIDKSQFTDIRLSKLVPYPKQLERTQTYRTYFTAFINLVDSKTAHDGKEPQNSPTRVQKSEMSRVTSFISMNSKQNSNVKCLQTIYSDQGIYHDFNYNSFDFETVKNLARLLLGEEDKLNCRTSADLFGQDVLDKLMLPPKGSKKKIFQKTKTALPKDDASTRPKKQLTELPMITEEFSEKINRSLISGHEKTVSNIQEPQSSLSKIKKISIAPGDDEWEYCVFIIPEFLLIALATIWESIEFSYLGNLKNLFFIKRMLNSRLIPYLNFIKQTTRQGIEKLDVRQDLVSAFQTMFNSIDNDLRKHTEQKKQLHCKVYELQQQLWKLCDEKKNCIEQKVTDLIHDNWASNEMCNLTNSYLQLLQTEMDRSINTLKLLCDYYLAMLGKFPSETNIFPVKISNTDVKLVSAEKMGKKNNSLILNKSIFSTMFDILTNTDNNGNTVVSPFHEIITKSIESAFSKLDTLKKQIQSTIQKEQSVPKVKEEHKKITGKKNVTSPKTSQVEDVTLKYNLFAEWEEVVDQEIDRVVYRFKLIKYRALKDLTLWQQELKGIFTSSFNSILNRYHTEIESVDNLCITLRSAVEEETPISERLLLTKDKFYIDTNSLLFDKISVRGLKELEEEELDTQFTIEQLDTLRKIMQYVSPKGIIGINTFIYILQDIIHQSTIYNKKFLPKIWNNLKLSEIESLVETIVCTSSHVDWKDFLIFCSDLGFPDLQEILEARLQFISCDKQKTEIISLKKYSDVVLWFEKDLPKNPKSALRIVLAKEFLYKLFQVNHNEMNYTALLLHFCKDPDPRLGFGKALALALGKGIIFCEQYLYLEEKNDSVVIKQILTEIIENVIQSVAGVVLKELSVKTVSDHSANTVTQSNTSVITIEEENETEPLICDSAELVEFDSDAGTSLLFKSSQYSDSSDAQNSQLHSAQCDIPFKYDLCHDIKWVSKIPVQTVLAVLTSTVLKSSEEEPSSCIQEIISTIKKTDDFQDGCIPAHILINLECMKKLFYEFYNFKTISVSKEMLKVINKNNANFVIN